MPELPEVQALAADLGSRLRGRVIDRLQIVAFPALKTYDPPVEALSGQRIVEVVRRGKFLDFETERGLHIVLHLARAGWIRWRAGAPQTSGRPGHGPLAARLVLDDGSGFDVTEAGTKKSLAVYVVRQPSHVPGIARLGPDPLDDSFTLDVFRRILAAQGRAQLKGVLRDQSVIAGIGNAYSDEILHVAKMSPYKPAAMDDDDSASLFAALRSTLEAAVERGDGVPASELKAEKKSNLRVHRRFGEPCPVCGTTIQQVIYADRTFQYCPTCQTGGKKLSDRVLDRLLK
jgi:formamidopyrimidine-DNA glycosylase